MRASTLAWMTLTVVPFLGFSLACFSGHDNADGCATEDDCWADRGDEDPQPTDDPPAMPTELTGGLDFTYRFSGELADWPECTITYSVDADVPEASGSCADCTFVADTWFRYVSSDCEWLTTPPEPQAITIGVDATDGTVYIRETSWREWFAGDAGTGWLEASSGWFAVQTDVEGTQTIWLDWE